MYRRGDKASTRMTAAYRQHGRQWRDHRYVYAVVSRRSRGISVGMNLNPNKACNFDCVYCQVDRRIPPAFRNVSLVRLEKELNAILQAEKDGSLYVDPPFSVLSPEGRGVKDIAFSGDGEPTLFRGFGDAVRIAAEARRRFGLISAKLVLLTNATRLDTPSLREGLAMMDENNGEIWAKLDAGTETYYRTVNRSAVSLDRILNNILGAARLRPLVIQSLWSRMDGILPPDSEVRAFGDRVSGLISDGGQIKAVQIHTIARDPAESNVSPLSDAELDRIAFLVRSRAVVAVDVYYSS